ncbi:LysR family transcriptional regulator [Leeia sp. TBRC 13508]|uniref:LysR family transcriptional regulator n=1 Tax=Leeia speluncae TaxID=2884804 RepID=A0ABS8D8T1_9NEIS|nr:LysR family transcriptional regulator [Leeia speluncae]MCB6184634.1 LysR family transcriptional regulator [Leeia speluncae]
MNTPELQGFDLNLLQTLQILLGTRNVSHAAAELGLSQPAISRQLARLRQHFGDPLLVREGTTYLLTPLAEKIGQKLPNLMHELQNVIALEAFDPATCTRKFVLSSSDYIAEHMLPDIIAYTFANSPQIDISYKLWKREDYAVLFNGEADLITTISEEIPAGLHGKTLGEDQPVCLMRKDNPLAKQETLSLDEYLQELHITINGGSDKDSRIDTQLRKQSGNFSRKIKIDVPFYASALKLVQQSDLLLTLPLHIAINYSQLYPVVWRPIPLENVPPYQYWILWHEKNHWDAAHQWFRNLVYQVLNRSIHGITHFNNQQDIT